MTKQQAKGGKDGAAKATPRPTRVATTSPSVNLLSRFIGAPEPRGVADASQPLPHLARLQPMFGRHDLSGVVASIGAAPASFGARAYTLGEHVAFRREPDVTLAAHEAAHVIQQRKGANVDGERDRLEAHADSVADQVSRGHPVESLLDLVSGSKSTPTTALQFDRAPTSQAEAELSRLLAQTVGASDVNGQAARVLALMALAATTPADQALALAHRLDRAERTDELANAFHHRLSSGTRGRFLQLLHARAAMQPPPVPTPTKEATAPDPQWPAIARVLNREAQPLDDGGQPTPADLQVLLSHLERDDFAPNESLRAATHLTRLFDISTDHRWLQSVVAARLDAFIERVGDQWYAAASARPVIVKARAFLDAHSHQYVNFAEHQAGGAVLGMLATPAHMDEPVMTIKSPGSPNAVPAIRRKEVTPERIEEIKRDAAIMVMIAPLLGAAEIGRLLEVFAGFPIGVLEGAWDSAKDLVAAGISNIKELGSLIGSIFTGEFRSKLWELGKKIWHFITSLPDLASALGEWFAHEWESRSYFGKGRLLGEIVGYIAFTIAVGVLTEGASLEGEGGPLKQAAMKLLKVVDKAANPFTYVKPIAKVAAAIPGVKAVGEVASKVAAPIGRIAAPVMRVAGAPGRAATRVISRLLRREGVATELVEEAEVLAGRERRVPSMTEIEAAPAQAEPARPRIGTETHDLTPVAVDGELWLRLCSKKCGPLLAKLQAVLKALEGAGLVDVERRLTSLIDDVERLQTEWATLGEQAAEKRLWELKNELEKLAAEEPQLARAIAEGDVIHLGIEPGETGTYSTTIKWGIQEVPARPAGPGFWGKRTPQPKPRVDAYELKINPNNESYYLPHPDGGFVQFENALGSTLEDGKLVEAPVGKTSWYRDFANLDFARKQIIGEARRQVEAASAVGLSVEWRISDRAAVTNLNQLFATENIPINVTFLAE